MAHDDPDHSVSKDASSMIEFQSPGRFQIDNPAARPTPLQEWSAAPFSLDVDTTIQPFHDMTEAREHALSLIEQVRRNLSIYTPDLEPWLYNHSSIQTSCARFLRAHPRNRLRILVGDSSRAVTDGHRLVSLSRRLTSNCHIRSAHPDYSIQTSAFLIADECGMLIRPNADQFSGHALYRDPTRARQQQRLFDAAWDRSLPDPDMRSFLI
ncbi:histone acetyltransferase HPA2 [Stutzerimonas chloritidismutans]|uniref:Histone acetyltransferase HPA2 n=1 Tax=Stutzerimonas chloritidismutans TaxID=203192 RepID=A0ABU9M7T3_STUCH